MSAADLWVATKAYYDATAILTLTNSRDRGPTTPDDTIGEAAAQRAIDLWPVYAQTDYDALNATHVAVGVEAVRALLMRRGGASPEEAQSAWDEVFGPSGTISQVKKTGPRSRIAPQGSARRRDSSGRILRPWYDPKNVPCGVRPRNYREDGTT